MDVFSILYICCLQNWGLYDFGRSQAPSPPVDMLLLYLLPFTCQALVATARTLPTVYQFPRLDQTSMSKAAELKKVPGHNNATFCPGVEQLFKVEFLEIAPDPVPV